MPEDACYFAKNKGVEGCVSPCPPVSEGNVDVWRLFTLSFGLLNCAGMDGTPIGHRLADVEALARALSIEWDEQLVARFFVLQGFWLDSWQEARKREKKK